MLKILMIQKDCLIWSRFRIKMNGILFKGSLETSTTYYPQDTLRLLVSRQESFAGAGIFFVSGLNKSLSDTGIDFVTKYAFGNAGLGGHAKAALEPLKAPQIIFLFQLPIGLAGKITAKTLKDLQ